jgi:hypothetical protein
MVLQGSMALRRILAIVFLGATLLLFFFPAADYYSHRMPAVVDMAMNEFQIK